MACPSGNHGNIFDDHMDIHGGQRDTADVHMDIPDVNKYIPSDQNDMADTLKTHE